jgi:hypothetical protein
MEERFRRMFDIDSWAASPKLSAYNRQLRRARPKEQRPTHRNMVQRHEAGDARGQQTRFITEGSDLLGRRLTGRNA